MMPILKDHFSPFRGLDFEWFLPKNIIMTDSYQLFLGVEYLSFNRSPWGKIELSATLFISFEELRSFVEKKTPGNLLMLLFYTSEELFIQL